MTAGKSCPGDTFWPAWVTGILCWTIVVGGGASIGFLAPQWGPTGPWVAASVYGLVLGVYLFLRFARGDWKPLDTNQARPDDAAEGSNERLPSTTVEAAA